jgi:hypothetical protein
MTDVVRESSRLWNGSMVPTAPFSGLSVEGENGRVLRCQGHVPTTAVLAGALLTRGKFYYEVTVGYDVTGTSASGQGSRRKHKRGGGRGRPFALVGWVDLQFIASGSPRHVGSDAHGWAFDVFHRQLFNGSGQAALEWGDAAAPGDVIGVAADLDASTMSFSLNGVWDAPMGVAFNNVVFAAGVLPAVTIGPGSDGFVRCVCVCARARARCLLFLREYVRVRTPALQCACGCCCVAPARCYRDVWSRRSLVVLTSRVRACLTR